MPSERILSPTDAPVASAGQLAALFPVISDDLLARLYDESLRQADAIQQHDRQHALLIPTATEAGGSLARQHRGPHDDEAQA